MLKILKLVLLLLILSAPGAALADWPERELTLITSMPERLPWGAPNPQARALARLTPRLSRELGVPVTLRHLPDGFGVMAGNAISGSRLDGYVAGALGPDPALSRVIQGYTPYVWDDLTPLATGWVSLQAIVVAADNPASSLKDLAAGKAYPRLARLPGPPEDAATVLAMEAASLAGITWELTEAPTLDPAHILEGKAEAMALPLGWLPAHPQADKFKVLAVLGPDVPESCLNNGPTVTHFIKTNTPPPLFAFYFPAKVNWRARNILSTAVNNVLKVPGMINDLETVCLNIHQEGLEGAVYLMGNQYELLRQAFERYGFETVND